MNICYSFSIFFQLLLFAFPDSQKTGHYRLVVRAINNVPGAMSAVQHGTVRYGLLACSSAQFIFAATSVFCFLVSVFWFNVAITITSSRTRIYVPSVIHFIDFFTKLEKACTHTHTHIHSFRHCGYLTTHTPSISWSNSDEMCMCVCVCSAGKWKRCQVLLAFACDGGRCLNAKQAGHTGHSTFKPHRPDNTLWWVDLWCGTACATSLSATIFPSTLANFSPLIFWLWNCMTRVQRMHVSKFASSDRWS